MSLVTEYKARLSPLAGQAGLTALDYGARAATWLKGAFNALKTIEPGPSPLLSFQSTPLPIDYADIEQDGYALESAVPFAADYALPPKKTVPEKLQNLPYTPRQLVDAQRAAAHELEYRREMVWGDVSIMGREKDIKPTDSTVSQAGASRLDSKTYEALRCHL